MNPTFSKHDVAFHEAGHAVCQRLFDEATTKVAMTLQEDGEWWGETHRQSGRKIQLRTNFQMGGGNVELPDVTPLVRECVIAAAGCIAQALKAAREEQPNANLSVDQDWARLHDWLNDRTLVTDKPRLALAVVRAETPHEVTIPSRCFSSGDQKAYCKTFDAITRSFPPEVADQFLEQLSSDLSDFIRFLNRPETWEVMCQIADSLAKQETSPSVVEEQELNAMLDELTCD